MSNKKRVLFQCRLLLRVGASAANARFERNSLVPENDMGFVAMILKIVDTQLNQLPVLSPLSF